MTDHPSGDLAAVGWSDRVAAAFVSVDLPTARPGRVIGVERGGARAATAGGEVWVADPALVVGDWVAVGRDGDTAGVIPRWSELGRLDPDGGHQVLAANVDVVLVVAPADRLSLGRIERELVLAWDSGARPIVVVTKADLAPATLLEEVRARLVTADVVITSSVAGVGLGELEAHLSHPVTGVLLGPSGAGKSTLLNALLGAEVLDVGDVRAGDSRGRHTTTSRRLLPIPAGGSIIDMPGLRSLGLDVDVDAVAATFSDIDELSGACRFHDCHHAVEPGCAVVAAVETGDLDPARLASYRKLVREIEADERRRDPLVRKAHVQHWKALQKEGRARSREKRSEG